jgi:hypothetical protein
MTMVLLIWLSAHGIRAQKNDQAELLRRILVDYLEMS